MVYNRRIGERVLLGATKVVWQTASEDLTDAWTESGWGLLMDVSVTGAGLFAPANSSQGLSDRFILGFDNAQAAVEVRRVQPVDDVKLCYYGVEFIAMDDEFERTLHDAIERGQAKDSPQ